MRKTITLRFASDLGRFLKDHHRSAFVGWDEAVQTVVAAGIEQVRRDMAKGHVPEDCVTFAQLHDHVDANYYGNAFEWGGWQPPDENDTAECDRYLDEFTAFWNEVQAGIDDWLKKRASRMTFEAFRATGKYRTDMRELLQDDSVGPAGMVYLDCLHIDDVQSWPKTERDCTPLGRWYLLIGRSDWQSDDLTKLERKLYEWAGDEGFLDR
jgi:hypothetical protein